MLPRDAGPNRRYCDTACRSRHWRRVQRREEIYQRAVEQSLDLLRGGGELWVQGLCPACGRSVSIRKRTDAVYYSPKCRTRAWRLRWQPAGTAIGDASERPSR
ncbi:hypothetical protein PV350_43370 [Streptomyces sp. PA03-6a]|nr:hypothetical protein [Streptomyces sp. PA03-6a]